MITLSELESAAHKQGLASLDEVERAVLEPGGTMAFFAIVWTIPTRFLTGLAAASGLAFINSVATLGGFVGPYAMGWLRDATGSFSAGLLAMAGLLVLATVMS